MRIAARSALLGLAFLASSVSAQGIDTRLVASSLDVGTRTAIAGIIDSARASGLPTEPLIDKALEGAARGAPSQRIISAVRTFATQLHQSRDALGGTSTEKEVLGGAQAIRAGISTQQLGRLRSIRSSARIAAALTVAADVVARGVPIDTAVAMVSKLVLASATDDQLLAVRADIENDILSGMAPAVAAATRGIALEQTLAENGPPNSAGPQGTLPSPSGIIRDGGPGSGLKPPNSAVGHKSPADAPAKPPVSQRKRP